MIRGFGGTDGLGLLLLIGGGVLAIGGAIAFFNSTSSAPTEAPAAPQASPNGSGSQAASVSPVGSPIEQLKRLAALKERGALTESEFEAQKRKLLS